ncbi:conserved unknown protein [Ectocarpus siliculosus]|uniref:Uncharacterized protein n=1 Tax=Ectocarpus siliculosus TaxID=2880 RepID=D7G3C3_ECTSI|nr:conserved unknown protein [Ectocarpus siliculosus]|eukprot:CBJ33517.1 conserved unknown protein [Ectocarpus siliculosus]
MYLQQVGFMFDNALPKTRRSFRFGDISVAVRLVDDDPGAVQSGHYVWPAAPALSAYLVDRRLALPRGGRCLELGAGCGLAGLVAAQLPLTKAVVFTDHDPGVLDMIRESIEEQQQQPELGGSAAAAKSRCVQLSWGTVGNAQRASLAHALSSVAASSTPRPRRDEALVRTRNLAEEVGGSTSRSGPGRGSGAGLSRGRIDGARGDGSEQDGSDGDDGDSSGGGGVLFDLVIASDVIYSVSVVEPLFLTVGELLRPRCCPCPSREKRGEVFCAEGAVETGAGEARPPREPAPGKGEEAVERRQAAGTGGDGSGSIVPEEEVPVLSPPKPPLREGGPFDDESSSASGGGGGGGADGTPVFLMSQSFGYDPETEKTIERACVEQGLVREVVWDELHLAPTTPTTTTQERQEQQEPPPPEQRQQRGAGEVAAKGEHPSPARREGGEEEELLVVSRPLRAGTKLQRFWRA